MLFFIRRDELDIYDIPIAKVTDDFLAYVRVLEEIDLDGVGDFIYVAALLINIKVRMLLPRTELDEEGEPLDPRTELVERLLEYVRYKEAAEQLQYMHDQRGSLFTRGSASSHQEDFATDEIQVANTSIFDLIGALRRVLTHAVEDPPHEIAHQVYSLEEQRHFVLTQLDRGEKVRFAKLASHQDKGFIIATFLAILEMARQGEVLLSRTKTARDFYVGIGKNELESTNGQA